MIFVVKHLAILGVPKHLNRTKFTPVYVVGTVYTQGYDGYSSCKSGLKKYCPASRKKWAGYIEEYDEEDKEWYRPYRLLSESEFGVYLEVLNFYFGRQAQFPAVL